MIPVSREVRQDGRRGRGCLHRSLFGACGSLNHPAGDVPQVRSVLHVTPGRRQPLVAGETSEEPPGHCRERVRVDVVGADQHAEVPSLRPGRYFRMLFIGYFEGLTPLYVKKCLGH